MSDAGRGRREPPALARWVAGVLRWGTLAAAAVIAAGFAWATLGGQPAGPPRGVIDAIAAGSGDGMTAAGLLALTLVPIAVLGVAAAAFWRAREQRMTMITLAVAGLLVASLVAAAVLGSAI